MGIGMKVDEFEDVLKVGEHIGVEFKSARGGAKDFVIYADHMTADNASKALKCGPVTPDNLSPVSKNSIIARFFKQMGRADELGSGTKNLYHYTRLYSGCDPQLDEGDTFSVTIPLNETYSADKGDPIKSHKGINDPIKPREGMNETVNEIVNEIVNETVNSIVLELIRKTLGIGSAALVPAVGKSRATVMRAVALLKQRHLIEHRGSDKTGGYYAI